VVLTNAQALAGRRRKGWSWYRGRKVRHQSQVLGLYHHASRTDAAWIELFLDRIYGDAPAWMMRSRFLRTLMLAPTLYHEIGHHIHATSTPEHREREPVADDWSRRLRRIHLRRSHPLMSVALQPLVWLRRRRRSRS